MTTRGRGSFFLVFLASFLPMILSRACSSTDPRQEALDAARALWASNQMTHYRFRHSVSLVGMGGGILRFAIVEVENGAAISVTDLVNQNSIDQPLLWYIYSIEMVFDRIQKGAALFGDGFLVI